MRLSAPRIAPLADSEMDADQKELTAPMAATGRVLNIFRTLARTPKAARGFLAWGNYILSRRNDLPPRQRELVILRVGYLCKSGYEWTQHVEIGLRDGLTAPEIARIKQGADAADWSEDDSLLLRATDELHTDKFISDPTWAALSAHFTEKQRMDLVYTVGQYTQVSMILNTFGVPLDAGQVLDPDLKGF
ncbi:carboxymuconolactone decarboxylase family protein [Phenylobacterium sp.]|jgi:4-carboxymuconolactone decarboxylase|uniref:carboxymuconolactone decarboxylase family protein n=1 Tax=Phenylobacterium sp. TaxID=1871053 RepID=UPI0037C8C3B4